MNTKLALTKIPVNKLLPGDYICGSRETVLYMERSATIGRARLLLENYKGVKRAATWGNRTLVTIERSDELPR